MVEVSFMTNELLVNGQKILTTGLGDNDFISLTDIARTSDEANPGRLIHQWLNTLHTFDFLVAWERINDTNFNFSEFKTSNRATINGDKTITVKLLIEKLHFTCIKSVPGRYGGTLAQKDIALEFASWLSPELKLYIIKEFQRLKAVESKSPEWPGMRLLSKLNYLLQTEAIKKKIPTINLTPEQISHIYAAEADVINVATFGCTAAEYEATHHTNVRDQATTVELAILSNLEFANSKLILLEIAQRDRLIFLNEEANKEKEIFNHSLEIKE
jgi:hypothetical protein